MGLSRISTQKKRCITANLTEYSEKGTPLTWLTEEQAFAAERKRAEFMKILGENTRLLHKGTKLSYGDLSPGCQICGAGDWSCLFINGKCNCRCFYCPTVQNEISVPTTNRIPFTKPADYVDYTDQFGFKGVSISGGEPLLTFDKTLNHIKAVRKKHGDDFHIWMYTNGTLLKKDHITKLKDAGLKEIRFDISAADYDLAKIALAAGQIPHVTVEIPAIPEDGNRLKALLPSMEDAGVNYLNLHQLRLTPFNYDNLITRPYTFLHGDKVTVLESEFTAFSILEEAILKKRTMNINYCSFVYKNRFQKAAARKKYARFILKEHESITENGFIRSLAVSGPPLQLEQIVERFKDNHIPSGMYVLNAGKDQLFFHESLWPHIDVKNLAVSATYGEAMLSPAISYHHYFREIRLNKSKKIYVEKRIHAPAVPLTDGDIVFFDAHFSKGECSDSGFAEEGNEEIKAFELIYPGLQDYY